MRATSKSDNWNPYCTYKSAASNQCRHFGNIKKLCNHFPPPSVVIGLQVEWAVGSKNKRVGGNNVVGRRGHAQLCFRQDGKSMCLGLSPEKNSEHRVRFKTKILPVDEIQNSEKEIYDVESEVCSAIPVGNDEDVSPHGNYEWFELGLMTPLIREAILRAEEEMHAHNPAQYEKPEQEEIEAAIASIVKEGKIPYEVTGKYAKNCVEFVYRVVGEIVKAIGVEKPFPALEKFTSPQQLMANIRQFWEENITRTASGYIVTKETTKSEFAVELKEDKPI